MINEFENKVVLVTGGTGTIGSELVRRILEYPVRQVRVLSRDDTRQYKLLEDLKWDPRLRCLIGDVRDKERLHRAFENVDIIYHAAALKHVPIGEYNPFELIKTNVIGSQNVVDVAIERGVKKVIGVSTDKAVNPTSIMGTTKLLMEKLFLNANYYKGNSPTLFSCVRFGNVAWARGSVFDLWKKHAAEEGVIRVTNGDMTRFIMSQAEAVELIFEATRHMRGNEVFVFKMPAASMYDLANAFLQKYHPNGGVRVLTTGARPGEKLHEELIGNMSELGRLFENERMFVIIPKVHIYARHDEPAHEYSGMRECTDAESYASVDHIDVPRVASMI